MTRTRLQFHFDWKPTLLALVGLPLLTGLGFWQLQRAGEKAELAQQYTQRMAAPAVDAGRREDVGSYRNLVASGSYLNQYTVLLDNRIRGRRFGYEVLTLLRLDSGSLLWVNRGWLEGDPSRRSLPDVPPAEGRVTLAGHAYRPQPLPTRALAEPPQGDTVIAQWADLRVLRDWVGGPARPYLMRLKAGAPGALLIDWPAPDLRPERHTAYAVQWFAMALVLLLFWFVLSTNWLVWWRARRGDHR